MKKWYQWLYLSLIFAVGGVVNYWGNRQITAAIIQVCITAALALTQFLCDKQGEHGKKVFGRICTAAILLLVFGTLFLLFGG